MIIDHTFIRKWHTAEKTKSIRVKAVQSLFPDVLILQHVLLTTLEGNQRLSITNYVCLGDSGEPWQQSATALFKKYDPIDWDENGWIVMQPKPEYFREAYQVLDQDFSIHALWGEETPEGIIQSGCAGDYIVRDPNNHEDVWIVKQKTFENTYEIK